MLWNLRVRNKLCPIYLFRKMSKWWEEERKHKLVLTLKKGGCGYAH